MDCEVPGQDAEKPDKLELRYDLVTLFKTAKDVPANIY